jgi:GNAT superfamily N-acetyltransferase
MTLTWTKENSPRWDADKQRVFGPAELAAVGLAEPAPGEPVADEWWRVTDGDQVAGYGWLDTEWGDARITFVVAHGRRGRGVGAFILEHLEDEAVARGLNYLQRGAGDPSLTGRGSGTGWPPTASTRPPAVSSAVRWSRALALADALSRRGRCRWSRDRDRGERA